MPDFRELYTSNDFAAYQDEIVDEVVGWLQYSLSVMSGAHELKAGMDLAERILRIPSKTSAVFDVQKRLEAAIKARLISIPTKLFKREMFTE